MPFMQKIIEFLGNIVTWLAEAAIWAWDSVLPLNWLGEIFYYLHWEVLNIISRMWDFDSWLWHLAVVVEDILSWDTIQDLLLDWLPHLEHMHDWWYNWTVWVGQQIDSWWASIQLTVQGWIAAAVSVYETMLAEWTDFWDLTFPAWTARLDEVKAAWDNFWAVIFPTLVDFAWLGTWWDARVADISALIDSAFVMRVSLWAGWQDIRDSVLEFFADPLEWLWTRFTDWFLGPEV